ncbi:MAG: hypothetical protein ACK58T_37875, partial [Phycisphaerae bacterium]
KGQLAHVVVAGCLVQKVRRELAERFPEVDLFAEISDYKALAKSVATLSKPRYSPAWSLLRRSLIWLTDGWT